MAQQTRSITRLVDRRLTAAMALATIVLFGVPSSADDAGGNKLLTEVHFDPGSTAITPGGQHKVRLAIAAIKKRKPSKIRVIGFTDSTGDEAINQQISEVRAETVASLLVEQGITTPLVIEGRGEKGAPYKIEDNVSEPLNRCVGIIAIGAANPGKPLL